MLERARTIMGEKMMRSIHAAQTDDDPIVCLKMVRRGINSIGVFDINYVQDKEY
jgi:hypothetical protein